MNYILNEETVLSAFSHLSKFKNKDKSIKKIDLKILFVSI